MNNKSPWRELTPEERLKRFEGLDLPKDVKLNNKADTMELVVPLDIIQEILGKMIQRCYITFNIEISHKNGNAVIGTMMPNDRVIG